MTTLPKRTRTVVCVGAILGACANSDGRDIFTVDIPPWREAGNATSETALLAEEAERRGLGKSYAVQRALRIAVARRVIDERFRPTADPAKLTDAELETAFKQNYWHFNRPPFVSLAHLLFHASDVKKKPEQLALARKLCDEVVGEAQQAKSAEAFRALKAKVEGRGLPIIHEELRTWPGKLEKPFEDVAFKMRTPGEVSGCVESTYGSHIIYLYRYEAGVERTFAEAKEEVRRKSAEDFAAHKFALWLKKLRPLHRASVVPDVIARLRQEAPVGGTR